MKAAAQALLGGGDRLPPAADPAVAEAAAAFGLRVEFSDPPPEAPASVSVWADHKHAVQAFGLCMGLAQPGPRGWMVMDHAALCRVLDRMRLRPRKQLEVLRQIAVMESEWLAWANPQA